MVGNAYGPGRTRWTSATGWLMAGSAAAAVLCAIAGVSPYPPLTVEVGLAGASALFAVCWVAASLHARRVPPRPDLRKRPPGRPRGRLLRIAIAFGIPFATFAALVVCFTGSGEEGRHSERLERAGYDRHEARIVRLTGEPEHSPATDDHDAYYTADVVLSVPYDGGPRDVAVEGVTTGKYPEPGTTAEVYFAPAHPEVGVGIRAARPYGNVWITVFLALVLAPWPFVAGAAIKSYIEPRALEKMRRFDAGTHLPALGLLLLGVLALLPLALEVPVAGFTRLWAPLALPAPALALAWMARRA